MYTFMSEWLITIKIIKDFKHVIIIKCQSLSSFDYVCFSSGFGAHCEKAKQTRTTDKTSKTCLFIS